MRILVVEDDPDILSQWTMEVETYNAAPSIPDLIIDLKMAKNLAEANTAISDFDIDAAVIDINLHSPDSNVGNKDGNIVLEKILDSELAVVAVLSGEPSSAETPEWATKVNVFVKGNDGVRTAMTWLLSQAPMIKQIKLASNQIKKEMVQLFTRSIWPRWNCWVENSGNNHPVNLIEDALTRHLTAHVYGVFLEKSEHKVHPEEWYFVPSIRTDLRTGDLIKNSSGLVEILVTPRCDLSRKGKNESFQLAECKDVSVDWDKAHKKIIDTEKILNESTKSDADTEAIKKLRANVDKAKEELRQFSQHKSNSNVFHFLPRLSLKDGNKLGPFLINFDKIRSVSRADSAQVSTLTSEKFASITPEFLPSIVERLGSFFSRIGSPDYSHPD